MSILLSIFLTCGEKDSDHDTTVDTELSSDASSESSGESPTDEDSIVNSKRLERHAI